jgi:hypothetical protein
LTQAESWQESAVFRVSCAMSGLDAKARAHLAGPRPKYNSVGNVQASSCHLVWWTKSSCTSEPLHLRNFKSTTLVPNTIDVVKTPIALKGFITPATFMSIDPHALLIPKFALKAPLDHAHSGIGIRGANRGSGGRGRRRLALQ